MQNRPSLLKDSIIKAGAGAGKTKTLIEHILDFAIHFKDQSGRFPRIIVSTFTNKATQELKERLVVLAQEKNDLELVEYVSKNSQVHISTIHGVLTLFINRYGHQLGVDPSFSIIGKHEWTRIYKRILKNLIQLDNYSALLETYDLKTLIEMLSKYYIYKSEFHSFNRWSFDEIKTHLSQKDQELINRVIQCTNLIRAVGDHKWDEYALFLEDLTDLLKKGNTSSMVELLATYRRPSSRKAKNVLSEDELTEIESSFREIKERVFSPRFSEAVFSSHEDLSIIFEKLAEKFCLEVRKHKNQNGCYSISDLEHITLEAVRSHPELAKSFSKEWDYWLIDEYQDTSPIQEEILEALIQDRSRFLVGDPQQSIYLFRGARSEVFSNREEKLRQQGANTSSLIKNFRSSPELVEFFNDLFCKLSDSFTPMIPQAQSVEKWATDNIKLAILKTPEEELNAIFEHIMNLRSQGEDWQSICILGRTNDVLGEVARFLISKNVPVFVHAAGGLNSKREVLDMLSLFRFLDAPYDNENLIRLLRCPVFNIPDHLLVDWAQLCKRKEYWSHFFEFSQNTPLRKSFELLDHSLKSVKEKGLYHALVDCMKQLKYVEHLNLVDNTGQAEANVWKLLSILQSFEQQASFNPSDFYNSFLQLDSDYADETEAVATVEPKRVNLLTIHRSKGLEFPHVIIPKIGKPPRSKSVPWLMVDEEKQKWSIKVKDEEEEYQPLFIAMDILDKIKKREMEESDRVLYVGVTRAQHTLMLSSDEVIKNGSWLQKWPLETEEGEHKKQKYTLKVIKENKGVHTSLEIEPEQFVARKPWKEKEESEGVTSVTGMLSDKVMNTQSILSLFKSASRGQKFHRILEAIQKQPLLDWGRLVSEWFPHEAEEVSQALLYVMQLKDIPMFKILSEGRSEWGFVYNMWGMKLEGQVDLWAVVDGEVWIVDYKTGSSDWHHKAFKQLGIYSVPVRKFAKLETANLVALYPFEQKYFHKKADPVDVLTGEIRSIMSEI